MRHVLDRDDRVDDANIRSGTRRIGVRLERRAMRHLAVGEIAFHPDEWVLQRYRVAGAVVVVAVAEADRREHAVE